MLASGSSIHVRKLRPDGSEAFAWDGTVLRCDDQGIVLRAEFNVLVKDLGFVTLRRGDVFVEFYYWDRWYNVYQVSNHEGAFKGWYANVGAPAVLDAHARTMHYVDLELDVWAEADGSFIVLDEEEFTAYTSDPESPAELVAGAEQGRAALLRLAESGTLPTWPSGG